MANDKHIAKLKKDVATWNEWRRTHRETVPELQLADLTGADLIGADLSYARLTGANLFRADLTGANLTGAQLSWANLFGADLSEADFSNASIGYTTFGDNDLRGARNLETVQHRGPSTVGIDTIYRSQGRIPLAFLRRAGVPDNFLDFMGSMVGRALEFYSCFISYSIKDQEFADRLYADLQDQGVRCWFAREDLKTGDRFQEVIERNIRIYDKLLLVLSARSVASPWVEREAQSAMEKEHRSGSAVLFPVRLDDAVMDAGQAWAADIRRTRHIGNFRNWKNHDSYQKSFERLLRDLKAKDSKTV